MRRNLDAKYFTIFRDIVSKIKRGTIAVGDKVPSENDLIKKYGVSNTTARKALLELEMRGWARRIKGRGTFALDKRENCRLIRSISTYTAIKGNFADTLRRDGYKPGAKVFKRAIQDSPNVLIGGMNYTMDSPAMEFHALRYADDMLFKDEVKYINLALCPNVGEIEDIDPSINTYKLNYAIDISQIKRSLTASIMPAGDKFFNNSAPQPIFNLNGVMLSSGGQVVEIEVSRYLASKYEFTIDTSAK